MDTHNFVEAYSLGRGERVARSLEAMSDLRQPLQAVKDVFWSNAVLAPSGEPSELFPSPRRYRCEAVADGDPVPGLHRAGNWMKLQVTTNWIRPLRDYPDRNDYFMALSKKARKNLGYFDHVYSRPGIRFEPVTQAAQLDRFLEIFRTQWPRADWLGKFRAHLHRIYARLEEDRAQRSLIITDPDGRDAAAALGYYTGNAYNLHLLTRQPGPLDKYSPGFYLAYHLIREIHQEKRADYFIMGPGAYDYKTRFLARPLQVYRCEKITPANLPGLLKLWHRAAKQKSRANQNIG